MTKGDWGKIKAYFALDFNGVIVTDFKLIEGIHGLFIGFPSKKKENENGNVEYKDTVMATKEKREEILAVAMKAYDGIGDPIDFANNPIKPKSVPKKEEPAEAYDDGIPF